MKKYKLKIDRISIHVLAILVSFHLENISTHFPFTMAQIPTDFKTLFYYGDFVDKSDFINTISQPVVDQDKTMVIHRPEGWGKTIIMNMLETFFQIEVNDTGHPLHKNQTKNDKLFLEGKIQSNFGGVRNLSPLNISNSPKAIKHLGQYGVIMLSMKHITGNSYEEIENCLRLLVSDLFKKYRYLSTSPALNYRKRTEFNGYLNAKKKSDLKSSLYILYFRLHEHLRKRVMVLIDDYDVPLINAYLKFGEKPSEMAKVYELLKSFYHGVEQSPPRYYGRQNLRSGCIIAGVLDITILHRDFIWVSPNNYLGGCYIREFRYQFSSKYHENLPTIFTGYGGFLSEEVKKLLDGTSIKSSQHRTNLKNWYSGQFYFFNVRFYNPRSVMRCLAHKGELDYYGSESCITQLVDKIVISDEFQEKAQALVHGDAIYHEMFFEDPKREGISFNPLDGIAILYYGGYIRTKVVFGEANFVEVTNEEARYFLKEKILQWVAKKFDSDDTEFRIFTKRLTNGQMYEFQDLLKKYLSKASNFIQAGEKEAKLMCDGLRIALAQALSSNYQVNVVKQEKTNDIGEFNEVLLIPKLTEAEMKSILIKHETNLRGNKLKSIPRNKGILENPENHFHIQNNIELSIASSDDEVNVNIVVQRYTYNKHQLQADLNSTSISISFQLGNITDLCQYHLAND